LGCQAQHAAGGCSTFRWSSFVSPTYGANLPGAFAANRLPARLREPDRDRVCPSPIAVCEDAMHKATDLPRPKGSPAARDVWESQYASGAWDYLAGDDEAGHYLAIARLLAQHRPRGTLLDIGCGAGILLDHLQREDGIDAARYTGIDLAQAAVEQAAARHPGAHFLQFDYAAAALPGRFEAIIFNETLYCFADPMGIVDKCLAGNAGPDALLIVSMYGSHHEDIWTALSGRCATEGEEIVENRQRGVRWTIRALRQRSA
jgi:SAM-dependent methyltransferase